MVTARPPARVGASGVGTRESDAGRESVGRCVSVERRWATVGFESGVRIDGRIPNPDPDARLPSAARTPPGAARSPRAGVGVRGMRRRDAADRRRRIRPRWRWSRTPIVASDARQSPGSRSIGASSRVRRSRRCRAANPRLASPDCDSTASLRRVRPSPADGSAWRRGRDRRRAARRPRRNSPTTGDCVRPRGRCGRRSARLRGERRVRRQRRGATAKRYA